jgi:hypothetical protein
MLIFAERFGHSHVPPDAMFQGYPLGLWASAQREEYRLNCLDKNRKRQLESLPAWDWWEGSLPWVEGFAHLQVYVLAHGNPDVPRTHHTRNGYRLGHWVIRTRNSHRRGMLSEDHVRLMGSVPGWKWDIRYGQWERSYAEYLQAVQEHGGTPPPGAVGKNGLNLRKWLCAQRFRYDGYTADRRQRLRELPGWEPERPEDRWAAGYRELMSYIAEYGHAQVPKSHVRDTGYRLGSWVKVQRIRQRSGALCPDREARLNRTPGWSWVARPPDRWGTGFAVLERFAAEHGHARPSCSYVCDDGYRLGLWVMRQRQTRKSPEMTPERAARLESLPGWVWSMRDALWEEGFAHLTAYVSEHGHTDVPVAYTCAGGYKLGVWVKTQRAAGRDERITRIRRSKLNLVPGWKWSGRD